ncbi:MAG: hypothetical protein ACREQT_13665, partial [Candidatus Binataceae bacterium]
MEWPAEARVRLIGLQALPFDHWLLIRSSITDPADMAFCVTFRSHTMELKELAAVVGLRWTTEECFQSAKRVLRQAQDGLDHCAARCWHGWHLQMMLSMVALAFHSGLRERLKEAQIDFASGEATKG